MATTPDGPTPKAVIHKRILDEAGRRPEASMGAIAKELPGASTDLVEKVLQEYGDPAGEPTASENAETEPDLDSDEPADHDTESQSDMTIDSPTEIEELSEGQRETLRKINEEPTATQRDIAEELGVSQSTVNYWLGKITGFEWPDRGEFVTGLFDKPLINDGHGEAELDAESRLEPRVEDLEERLSAFESSTHEAGLLPELAHKVIHACMRSDQFSEQEELEMIRSLFGDPPPDSPQ